MERYDLAIPKDFRYGMEKGIILAAQIKEAIDKGTLHFKCGGKSNDYSPLNDMAAVLQQVHNTGCFISWHKDYGLDRMGLHGFFDDPSIQPINITVCLVPEIFTQIKHLLEAPDGVHPQV